MREHNLLLLHEKPERPKRELKGKIAVAESDMRWCSDGFEFGCDNGEKLRAMFALDCCDRETIDWAASTGCYDSSTVQYVMLGSVEKRFGDRLPDTPVQWLTDTLMYQLTCLANNRENSCELLLLAQGDILILIWLLTGLMKARLFSWRAPDIPVIDSMA